MGLRFRCKARNPSCGRSLEENSYELFPQTNVLVFTLSWRDVVREADQSVELLGSGG